MWKRMLEPGLVMFSLLDLIFSTAMAQLVVHALGWRFGDWLGIAGEPFDVNNSVLAYTLLGGVLWPVLGLTLAAMLSSRTEDGPNRPGFRAGSNP